MKQLNHCKTDDEVTETYLKLSARIKDNLEKTKEWHTKKADEDIQMLRSRCAEQLKRIKTKCQ